MAELADAHGSGPCGSNTLRVRLPSSALNDREVLETRLPIFLHVSLLAECGVKVVFYLIIVNSMKGCKRRRHFYDNQYHPGTF